MNKTLPLVAVAALAFSVLSTEAVQAQELGKAGLHGNGIQGIHRATLGPTIQPFVDFGTLNRDIKRPGHSGLPALVATYRWSPIAINEYGTLRDNRPTLLTAPSFQRKYVRNMQGIQTA